MVILKFKKISFTTHKSLTFKKDLDIVKVLVSNKIFCGERNYKEFIGCLHNDHHVKPLHIMLRKISAYVKRYEGQAKWMYFLIENNDSLEKCDTIWEKVSTDIKKEFDSEIVYDRKILKIKIKSHGDEVTDFYYKEIPKVDSNHTCLAVISLGFALNKDGNYYLLLARILKRV